MKRSFTQNFLLTIGMLFGAFLLITAFAPRHGHAATQPDAFIVEVSPSSFDVNQAVDLTIKAVTANGDIVQDYQGDVFIEIDGIVDTADYVVPSDGLYTFLPQDQGVKLFSKGLVIKKAGTFAVKVSDIINDQIQGQKTIIVGNGATQTTATNVTIISPASGGIEKNTVVNIIASAQSLPNSPYEVYLNNTIISQGTTDQNGGINTYISGAVQGKNFLQVKVSNVNNEIIGQSDNMNFTYTPISDGIFNSIQVLPSNQIKQGTAAEFDVNTADSVTSAELKLSNGVSLPMDMQTAGVFNKKVTMDTDGQIEVSLDLITAGQTKSYTGITMIFVEKSVTIGKIRLYADSIDKTKLNVTRETIGSGSQYKVQYGTSSTNLNQFVIVPTNQITIENLVIGNTYYFQITPLDENQNPIGPPSAITQAIIGQDLSCVVKGIVINDEKIGDKHYLVRSAVQNVDTYTIYRSDFNTTDTTQMQKVGETTGTMFEYPFNKLSKKDEYAYYVVEAACKDGTNPQLDTVKKVKVGPVENILLFIIIALFGYCIFKLNKYAKD